MTHERTYHDLHEYLRRKMRRRRYRKPKPIPDKTPDAYFRLLTILDELDRKYGKPEQQEPNMELMLEYAA